MMGGEKITSFIIFKTQFFYVQKESIIVSVQTILFSPIELELLLGAITPPEHRNDQKLTRI